MTTIILDTGALRDLQIGGPDAYEALSNSGSGFLITDYVYQELRGIDKDAFDNWALGRSDVALIDIRSQIDLRQERSQAESLGVVFQSNGRIKNLGDASIRYLEQHTGLIASGDARVLTDERALITWANEAVRPGGAYTTTLELLGDALSRGELSQSEYLEIGAALSHRIENNYPLEYRSLLLTADRIAQLDSAVANGFTIDGSKLVAIAAGAEVLRHAGVVGDVFGLAVTSAQASELVEQGQLAEAEQVWVSYLGDISGGAVGAVAGAMAAGTALALLPEPVTTALGTVILVVGAVVGGVAGSMAGEAFGQYLAERIQQRLNDGEAVVVDDIIAIHEDFARENGLSTGGYVGGIGGDSPDGGGDVVFHPECFLAGTPISLWDGTTKPIEAVRPEDWVVSYDREGNLVPGRVTRIFRNRAPHIIDLFGLMLTPGHVTLCGDGPLAGRHVPVIDILRTDGAVVRQDGSKVRAATGVPLGHANDRLIWAVAGMRAGTGATRVTDKARIRLGTRVITPDGEDVCIADQIARAGGRITDDGMIQTRIGGPKMPFHWPYAERLPRPEDYVLSRSGLTLAAIYQASDWEGAGSLLTVPEPASPGSAVQRRPRPADHGK